jgi:hypothetical protein
VKIINRGDALSCIADLLFLRVTTSASAIRAGTAQRRQYRSHVNPDRIWIGTVIVVFDDECQAIEARQETLGDLKVCRIAVQGP